MVKLELASQFYFITAILKCLILCQLDYKTMYIKLIFVPTHYLDL